MPVGYTNLKSFKGVNLTLPASELEDEKLAWARNCFPHKNIGYIEPRFVQRIAEKQLNTGTGLYSTKTEISYLPWASGVNDGAAEIGLYSFLDANGVHRTLLYVPFAFPSGSPGLGFAEHDPIAGFLHSAQSGLYFPNSDATKVFMPVTPGSPAGFPYVPRLMGVPKRPVSLAHNNELYLFLGHTYPGLILGATDFKKTSEAPIFRELGLTWNTGSGVTGDKFKFSFGDVFKGVFVMGGLPPPYESLLAFTEPGATPGTLLSVSKWPGIGFGDGDKLLRAVSTPIVGGGVAVEPYVLALKQRSVWLVQGVPPSSTDDGELSITPVLRREGLVAPHAVCQTPYGTAWCSGRNVWLMPPGTEPKPIGNDVKGFLARLPPTPVDSWYMEFHDDVLYLNFPWANGITEGNEFGGAGNASTARTYLPTGQLWCDLRNPDEPQWWGPQDVRAGHMLSLNLPDGAKQLVGVTPYWRNTTSYIVQPFTMAARGVDSQNDSTGAVTSRGYDLADPGRETSSAVPDDLAESTVQVVRSREFDFGDDMLEKIIEALETNATWDFGLGLFFVPGLGLDPASDAPFGMRWYKNGGVGAATVSNNAASIPARGGGTFTTDDKGSVGFTLDFNKLDTANALAVQLGKAFIPITAFPASASRFLGRTFQFEIYSLRGADTEPFTIDEFLTRHIEIKSFSVRVRPIGRRPGGSIGG